MDNFNHDYELEKYYHPENFEISTAGLPYSYKIDRYKEKGEWCYTHNDIWMPKYSRCIAAGRGIGNNLNKPCSRKET